MIQSIKDSKLKSDLEQLQSKLNTYQLFLLARTIESIAYKEKLEATIKIYASSDDKENLNKVKDELKSVVSKEFFNA
jgi:hypothetical protein